jgi:hypothetical protein
MTQAAKIELDATRLLGWQVREDGTAPAGVAGVKIGLNKISEPKASSASRKNG